MARTRDTLTSAGATQVRLMDSGSATTITINGAPGNSYGTAWLNIEKDPLSTFPVTITWGSQQQWPQMIRWRGGIIVAATGPRTFLGLDEASGLFCWDGITIGVGVEITWHAIKYLYNVTATGTPASLNGFSSSTYAIASAMGFVIPKGVNAVDVTDLHGALCVIGNVLPDSQIAETDMAYGDDGKIIYNNRLYISFMGNTAVTPLSNGRANIQNLVEQDGAGGVIAMNYFADSDLTTLTNYLDMHNTAVGGARLAHVQR